MQVYQGPIVSATRGNQSQFNSAFWPLLADLEYPKCLDTCALKSFEQSNRYEGPINAGVV